MRENIQTTVTSQLMATPVETASDKAGSQASGGRKRYSGNEVLRIMNALKSAKMDMDDERFSVNGVVHLVLEEIESLMQSHNCSYADIARLFASNGCPVSERTLQDYLARARKDAREGRTGYSRIRQLIIESAESAESAEPEPIEAEPASPAELVIAGTGQADPACTAEDCILADAICPASDEESCAAPECPDFDDMPGPDCGFLEQSVSRAMDGNETPDSKRQHIQAVYDARKRRKKARQAKKKGQAA